MAWSLPTQECFHHTVWKQVFGNLATRGLPQCCLGRTGLQPCQESSSSDSSPTLLVNLSYPNHLCEEKFVVNYLFLWQNLKPWENTQTSYSSVVHFFVPGQTLKAIYKLET